MTMIFEGDQDFAQSPIDLTARLSDARFLVECIPDAIVQGQAEAARAHCTVRPGLAFVRGSLDVTLEVTETQPAKSVRLVVASKGIGSSSDVEAWLTFSPHENGTRLHWKVEVKKLGGLLKAVPSGLIRGAAHKVIEDIWAQVKDRLK